MQDFYYNWNLIGNGEEISFKGSIATKECTKLWNYIDLLPLRNALKYGMIRSKRNKDWDILKKL